MTIRPSLGLAQAAAVCGLGGRISFVGMANAPTDTITLDIDSFHFRKLSLGRVEPQPRAVASTQRGGASETRRRAG